MDIHDYEFLMEDIEDLAACAERRNEETVPHDQFLEELRKKWLFKSLRRDIGKMFTGKKADNKSVVTTPDPPRLPAVMTVSLSTRSRSRALGQA